MFLRLTPGPIRVTRASLTNKNPISTTDSGNGTASSRRSHAKPSQEPAVNICNAVAKESNKLTPVIILACIHNVYNLISIVNSLRPRDSGRKAQTTL